MDLGTLIELFALIFGIIGIITPIWIQYIADRQNYRSKKTNLFYILQEELLINLHYVSTVDDYIKQNPEEYNIFLEQSLRIEIIDKLISLDLSEYLKDRTDLLFDIYSQALTINRLIDSGHQTILQDPEDMIREVGTYKTILFEIGNFTDEFIHDAFKLWFLLFRSLPDKNYKYNRGLLEQIDDYKDQGYNLIYIDRTSNISQEYNKKTVIICWNHDNPDVTYPVLNVRELTEITSHTQYIRKIPRDIEDPRIIRQQTRVSGSK